MARAQVVLLREKQILMACHQRSQGRYWVLPGVQIEAGETPEAAAIRETREETGFEIRLESLLFVDGPLSEPGIEITRPRFTFLGTVTAGCLSCPHQGVGGTDANGALCDTRWMPWHSSEYDAATRDTLRLVRESLP